jgi:CHAT domain-containing protein/tetratricopeptide (TPR) repeat protein
MDNLAGALPYCERALAIRQKVLGPEHPDIASSLNNLGALLARMGDLAAARSCYERALAIYKLALGPGHPDTASCLNNLGMLLRGMGDLGGARHCCERALAIREKALGPDRPDTADSLNNLGYLLATTGDLPGARPYYERALSIYEKALGPDHANTAGVLNNLGALHQGIGDVAGARPYLERALAIREKALGPEHPDTAQSLSNLCVLLVATGLEQEALPRMQQAVAIGDRKLSQVFTIGSDRQRTAFQRTLQVNMATLLSLVWRHFPGDADAVRAALDLVLRRKAVLAEALAAQRDAVLSGKYPRIKLQMDEWVIMRRQIARKSLAGPGPEGLAAHRRQLDEWEAARERLEAELARHVPEMNLEQQLRATDRRAVALGLSAGVSLVEFVRFDVFDFQAMLARGQAQWPPARYLAFVLRAGELDAVQMIDLGPADKIDRLIAGFRVGILREGAERSRNMVRNDAIPPPSLVRQLGLPLRKAVFDPLAPAIGPCRRLLLSPDGGLTRLPFELLPDEEGHLLLDDYHISYVGSGRDVLRFGTASGRLGANPLVIADPDFDLAGRAEAARQTQDTAPRRGFWSRLFGRRAAPAAGPPPPTPVSREPKHGRLSRDFNRGTWHFDRLTGTRTEGARIAALLNVEPWLDRAALEGRFKQTCRSPRILHLATHGFFLQDQPHDPNQERLGLSGFGEDAGRLSGPLPENPLLRAGLALAGANTWLRGGTLPEDAEDGILTAEDISGLDLLDTELVVLSACETGLGEVRTGEGVYGLQRAFVVAGAKTLVMSLWSVPDEATRELMEEFYRRLLAGEGRADALHAAQQVLRRKYPEPYFWGAFVCLGDPGPLATAPC